MYLVPVTKYSECNRYNVLHCVALYYDYPTKSMKKCKKTEASGTYYSENPAGKTAEEKIPTEMALLEVGGITILEHILRKIEKVESIDNIYIVTNDRFYGQFHRWVDLYKCPRTIKLYIECYTI